MSNVMRMPEPRPVNSRVGTNVSIIMMMRGKTQAQLGNILGVTQSSMSRRIAGHTDWSPDELEATAAFLNVAVGRLFEVLPGLDSNQEPIGFQSAINTHGKIIRPEFGGTRGLNKKTLAPVLKFRRA